MNLSHLRALAEAAVAADAEAIDAIHDKQKLMLRRYCNASAASVAAHGAIRAAMPPVRLLALLRIVEAAEALDNALTDGGPGYFVSAESAEVMHKALSDFRDDPKATGVVK